MGTLSIPISGGGTIDKATVAHTGVQMQMPTWIGENERSLWLLPYEPLIAVRGHNIITKRSIAKTKDSSYGSVKEVWTQDDFQILITGVLFDHNRPNEYPREMVSRLSGLMALKKPLYIQNALLDLLGVSTIVVEDWEFPPTANIAYQDFAVRAVSDQNFNLLIEK